MRAALYIRVSSDEQARHGLSLQEQRDALTRYAQEHKMTVAGIYERTREYPRESRIKNVRRSCGCWAIAKWGR